MTPGVLDNPNPAPPGGRPDLFIRFFLPNERRVLAYIAALVPRMHDAEDILQESAKVMWEKFDTFKGQTDSEFCAWAFQIAKFKVLESRRRSARRPMTFNDEVIRELAAQATDVAMELEQQERALAHCMEKLSEPDRTLLRSRFGPDGSLNSTAAKLKCSTVTARKRLREALAHLLRCVRHRLDAEGHAP